MSSPFNLCDTIRIKHLVCILSIQRCHPGSDTRVIDLVKRLQEFRKHTGTRQRFPAKFTDQQGVGEEKDGYFKSAIS